MPRSYRNLRKGLIRPDWNKHTLYLLSQLEKQKISGIETFFQQKWNAKALLRGYHNPYVREKRWQRMFDRRLPGTVPMDYRYLAKSDGSELAAGRGSGLILEKDGRSKEEQGRSGTIPRPRTPYMNMTFFPLEKRLDNVVFRALFASSLKQARSMVLHGAVKVNGKKMTHPGYLLNPGDLFQVDPDQVMYATGATKPMRRQATKKKDEAEDSGAEEVDAQEVEEPSELPASQEKEALDIDNAATASAPRKSMLALRHTAVQILENGKHDLPAAKLQELRAFKTDLLKSVSKLPKDAQADESAAVIAKEFQDRLANITATIPGKLLGTGESLLRRRDQVDEAERQRVVDELVQALIKKELENPYDESKPYMTPWRPRKYMSAFAFIPRYLEVNQNICAAVYLRHPVARPGQAEVPTPFHSDTAQLGFNWYLRRK